MNASQMIRSVCLAIAACIFTGCAVLTIDVDVYKGPLANDDKVQVEQLTAMTMGAKPLLVQLRDRLEGRAVSKRPGYIADYVRPIENREIIKSFFKEEHAEQVNAILSLYKDVFGDRLTTLFQSGKKVLDDYARALEVLESSKNQESWKSFQDGFIRGPGDVSTDKELYNLWTSEKTLLEALRKGYEAFLVPPPKTFRSAGARDLFKAHCDLAKRKPLSSPEIKLDGKPLPTQSCEEEFFKNASSNSMFRALEDRRVVEFHAKLLFRSDATAFIDRTVTVARSFTDAREELVRLWRLTMQFISIVNAPEFKERPKLKEMTAVAAELATRLIDHEHLKVFLAYADKLPPPPSYLTGNVGEIASIKELKQKLGRDFHRAALEELLRKEPKKTVDALIEVDELWAHINPSSVPDFPKNYLASEKRRFGIVLGPVEGASAIGGIIPAELKGQFQQLSEGAAIGLEQGRLEPGIETRIKSYLQKKDKLNPASPPEEIRAMEREMEREKDRLLDALVGFAQKILMLGNFSVLFEEEGKTEAQPFVSLLQAIGNGILTQVNELQTKKTYFEPRVRQGEMEARALNAENWPPKSGEKGRLIDGLHTPPTPPLPANITNDPRQVMDLVISKLQYEHVQALRRGESKDAEHLEAAIEAASTHRANMVYIRPASFYLRNSFLFTGLQKDSPATWRNMLSEHAWRQFSSSSTDKKAQIIQEFDKQYWQNVNTVRVAGGGKTNYVIAKDDVGNWYVKNFSSDPESIIQGAKSLALFAAKGAASVDQVDRATRLIRKPIKEKVEKEVEESDTDKAERVGTKSSEGEDEENDKDDVADEVKAKGKRKKPRKAKTQQASITVQGAVMEEQRKAAETSHRGRTKTMLTELSEESKGLDKRIMKDWENKGLTGEDIGFLKREVLESSTLATINTDVSPPPPALPPPTRERFDAALKTVTDYRDEIVAKISTERFVTVMQTKLTASEKTLKEAKENRDKFKTQSDKLDGISKELVAKEKELEQHQKKIDAETNPENKAKLIEQGKAIQNQRDSLKKQEDDAKEAGKKLKEIEQEIPKYEAGLAAAKRDLEIAAKVDVDKAKSLVKSIFATILLKTVDQRAEDLENYRIRLRAIRSDNAG